MTQKPACLLFCNSVPLPQDFSFANQLADSFSSTWGQSGGEGMNVIVFASRKGGSGKSTLAAHLAAQIKSTKALPADRCRSAGLAHPVAQAARHQRTADQDRGQFRERHSRHRQARRHRMGADRHAAESVGGRRRRHQERHHGDHSGAARRVRRQRGAGNHPDVPLGAQALCGGAERRAGAQGRRRKPDRHHRARGAGQIPRAGVGRPDHQPRRSVDGAGARAKARANIMPKAARPPKSPGCGPRSSAR